MRLRLPIALLGQMLCSSMVLAGEFTIHGAVKNETAYFISGEKRFDKVQSRVDLKPEAILTDRLEFRGRFLSWYDSAMDIEKTNTLDLTSVIKDYYRTGSEVKEAYFLYGGDAFDLRVGQQQIVWGKTDGLRLLDVVNPLDMREFMLDDFLDSRIGVVALRLNYYAYLGEGEHEFEFLVIPDAKAVKFAPKGSRWSYAMPAPLPGVVQVIHVGNEPSWSAKSTEYGAAWRSNVDGWDLSLNWFYGWKDAPSMQKNLMGTAMEITPVYDQMHTVGGSFSNAFDAVVLRGELAVNMNETVNMVGVTPATSVGQYTTWNMALGADYNKNNWRVSPQFFMRYLSGWESTVVENKLSGFMSIMASTDYLNDKLKPEIIALLNWSDGSWMLRPKVSYEYSDQIIAKLGVDVLSGKQLSFFGQFNANDRVYAEVEYTF